MQKFADYRRALERGDKNPVPYLSGIPSAYLSEFILFMDTARKVAAARREIEKIERELRN